MRVLSSLALLLLLQACKHPLAIEGEGDIVDVSGNGFGCTLEQYQSGDVACENDVQGDYYANYSAVPRPGWMFSHWDGSCGHLTEEPNCRFDVGSLFVSFWDLTYSAIPIPELTAVFVLDPNAVENYRVVQTAQRGGSIRSRSGFYDCAAESTCIIDVEDGPLFSDTFTAIPEPGFVFSGWKTAERHLCGGSTAPCELAGVPDGLTIAEVDASLVAVFEADSNFGGETDSRSYFESHVSSQVINDKCVLCHVEGGVAQIARIVFEPGLDASVVSNNYQVFQSFLLDDSSNADLVLAKVRGVSHGGGVQLSSSSEEYQSLSTFIGLTTDCGDSCVTGDWESFFSGVQMASAEQTLRRASIILAGRLPTAEELGSVSSGEGVLLRQAVLGLMEGEGFRQFLLKGANDRLLTDAFIEGATGVELRPSNPFHIQYPLIPNKYNDAAAMNSGEPPPSFSQWQSEYHHSMARAPLNLIAHVVKNDLPYSDILTADYVMQNAQLAEVYRSDLQFDDNDYRNVKPGPNLGQILVDDGLISEEPITASLPARVLSHSGYVDYPITGLLNTSAFLSRYPTTETNRNRARSRWTYYHFLGVDIEKLSGRTQDPDALADTNNPTLNNPNCTVCHRIMDPVAGAFQNYGIDSYYLESGGGMDSLPELYKYPEDGGDTDYVFGDKWFRDMVDPGFGNDVAPVIDEPLRWLAEKIVDDPRFATATVRFWWQAIMKTDPLRAPEFGTFNYNALLTAFELQSTDIESMADDFREHMRLKELLADMVLSPWFRSDSTADQLDDERAAQLQSIGMRALLTPDELNAKVKSITGHYWSEYPNDPDQEYTHASESNFWSELSHRLGVYYGGIDSFSVTTRSRQVNALMSNIVERQAYQIALHSVVLDFARPKEERLLFTHVEKTMSPSNELGAFITLSNDSFSDPQSFEAELFMPAGQHIVSINAVNAAYSQALQDNTTVFLDKLILRDSSNNVVETIELENSLELGGVISCWEGEPPCGVENQKGSPLFFGDDEGVFSIAGNQGVLTMPLEISSDDTYTLELLAYANQVADLETPLISLSVDALDYETTTSSQLIKQQLQYFHLQLLGEDIDLDSEELAESYSLLLSLWELRASSGDQHAQQEGDAEFNLPFSHDEWWEENGENANEWLADPSNMLSTWADVLTYFFTDFKFVHE